MCFLDDDTTMKMSLVMFCLLFDGIMKDERKKYFFKRIKFINCTFLKYLGTFVYLIFLNIDSNTMSLHNPSPVLDISKPPSSMFNPCDSSKLSCVL